MTVEGEVPVLLLRADIAGLSREEAVAWVHAWCTQSLAVAPSSASSSSSSSSASSSTSTTTRPFGGQSTSATAYDARVQARPGLPVGITSLPIKPTLTDKGARVVCQGLGPAFLDVEVVDTLGSSSAHTTLIVRQCMGERQMQQHSTSIRGLARDTEKAVLDKLQGDLPRTLGGETDVTFYTGAEAALHQASTTIASPAPPTGVTDVDDEYLVLQDKGAAKAADKEEEDARLRELVESLGLADALNLDEMDGDEWAADPNSPFAKKAVEAYEAFVQKQQETGGGGGDGGVAEAVAGMGDVMLEELQAASATPEDVRAMFESGLRSAEQEHTRVAEKGKKRKRILAAVKEVGAAKAEEEKATGVKGGLVTLQMMFEGTGLKGGVDILAGPPGEESVDLSARMARGTDAGVLEEEEEEEEEIDGEEEEEVEDEDEWDEALGRMGEADPLGDVGWDVAERFDVLVRELEATAESPDLFNSIASQYHNVFLSRHFLGLMRARVEACEAGEDAEVSPATPVVLARMVNFAEQLVLQLQVRLSFSYFPSIFLQQPPAHHPTASNNQKHTAGNEPVVRDAAAGQDQGDLCGGAGGHGQAERVRGGPEAGAGRGLCQVPALLDGGREGPPKRGRRGPPRARALQLADDPGTFSYPPIHPPHFVQGPGLPSSTITIQPIDLSIHPTHPPTPSYGLPPSLSPSNPYHLPTHPPTRPCSPGNRQEGRVPRAGQDGQGRREHGPLLHPFR